MHLLRNVSGSLCLSFRAGCRPVSAIVSAFHCGLFCACSAIMLYMHFLWLVLFPRCALFTLACLPSRVFICGCCLVSVGAVVFGMLILCACCEMNVGLRIVLWRFCVFTIRSPPDCSQHLSFVRGCAFVLCVAVFVWSAFRS